jgi:YihY family inner membrane protein
VSYYSFFSIFPLLLVLVTILGIVLDDNPELRDDLVDGALGQIPVIGGQLADEHQPLSGSALALTLGLATSLWAGLGAVGALQHAMDEIWDVAVHGRANFVLKRLRSIAALTVALLGIAASALLANVATLFGAGLLASGFGLLGTAVINVLLVAAAFRVLTSRHLDWSQILPGAIAGGLALLVLHQVGSFVVRHFLAGASDTYGAFAAVIALLSWFFLVGRALLMAAELNGVLDRHLYPRTMFGGPLLTDADRRAMLLDVERVQRDARIGYAAAIDGETVPADAQPETSR